MDFLHFDDVLSAGIACSLIEAIPLCYSTRQNVVQSKTQQYIQ